MRGSTPGGLQVDRNREAHQSLVDHCPQSSPCCFVDIPFPGGYIGRLWMAGACCCSVVMVFSIMRPPDSARGPKYFSTVGVSACERPSHVYFGWALGDLLQHATQIESIVGGL